MAARASPTEVGLAHAASRLRSMRCPGSLSQTPQSPDSSVDAAVLEGDAVQLFFDDPIEIPDAPLRAVRLGLALREKARC